VELIRGHYNLQNKHRGCAVTIGNFDGIHLGHQRLIERVREKAAELNLKSCVVSFEPLPVEYFVTTEKQPPRLTPLREKLTLLRQYKIDQCLILPFQQRLAQTTANDFIQQILIDGLDTKFLLAGEDFKFGKDRTGDIHTLQASGSTFDYVVEQAHTVTQHNARISSTQIRELLKNGNLADAASALGREYYCIQGRVEYGAQLGRTLGFPTANLTLKNHKLPVRGVFAAYVSIQSDPGSDTARDVADGNTNDEMPERLAAIANIGVKPTVHGTQLSCEVHLLDFERDLYGKRLRLQLAHKLRDEKKFAGLPELRTAIATDEKNARQWFANSAHSS